ncbi:MAG: hypothetical protein WCS42_04215 [Verrucomicrobiota bacterium]
MSLTLTNKPGGNFEPHPEGIHPAVCVDVMDQGLMEQSFQGVKKMVNKVKLVFESEAVTETGVRCTVSRSVTASLHPKSTLAEIITKWRGRPVAEGETIPLGKLIGACCTLVVSHSQSPDGTKTYANIDAVSKPTKKVIPSGQYDPAAARARFAEWKQKNGLPPMGEVAHGLKPEVGGLSAPASTEAAQQHRPTVPVRPVAAPVAAETSESDDVPF